MSDRTPLPKRAELLDLLEKLLPPNEEMDEVSASIILDQQGVDHVWLASALKSRLERRVADMHKRGEDVPPALTDMLAIVQQKTESKDEVEIDPGAWIDSLLSGHVPDTMAKPDRSGHVQAFRSRGREFLTEEDLQILREMATEALEPRRGNRKSNIVPLVPRPEDFARALLSRLEIQQPADLELVASAIGLRIRKVNSTGFEGTMRRMPGRALGIVAVRAGIRGIGRERFTIAHEIGHYVLPGHGTMISVCRADGIGAQLRATCMKRLRLIVLPPRCFCHQDRSKQL